MSNSTRVAPLPFTVTIPANHPALFSLGGNAFYEAAGDLVNRIRKAAALALIEDPVTRRLMERYHAALSTARGPGELLDELRARGVTELHGTDYGDPGRSLSALLRQCADQIDRAEAHRLSAPTKDQVSGVVNLHVTSAVRGGRTARKAKTPSPEAIRRQPGLKLPIKGGKLQAHQLAEPSNLQTSEEPHLEQSSRKARR